MKKKWVYESLVENERDAVGLIAYALYKERKHSLAKCLRDEGTPELEIQAKVQTFHDQTLQSQSLDDYREKATLFLESLFSQMEQGIRKEYEKETTAYKRKLDKEKAEYKKQLDKELKTHKAGFLRKVKAYQVANKSFLAKAWSWLISGIPSTLSSIFLSCLILGGMFFAVDAKERHEVLLAVLAKYFSAPAETTVTNRETKATSIRARNTATE